MLVTHDDPTADSLNQPINVKVRSYHEAPLRMFQQMIPLFLAWLFFRSEFSNRHHPTYYPANHLDLLTSHHLKNTPKLLQVFVLKVHTTKHSGNGMNTQILICDGWTECSTVQMFQVFLF